MKEEFIPRLCASTLFNLMVEARKPRTKIRRRDYYEMTDNLSDTDVFCGLVKVITGENTERPKGDSLIKVVSRFKRCETGKSEYIPFGNQSVETVFLNELKSDKGKIYKRIEEFKNTFLNEDKSKWLVCALIELLRDDTFISQDEVFEVSPDRYVKADSLETIGEVNGIIFITSVLQYVVAHYLDPSVGRDSFLHWYKQNNGRGQWLFVGNIGKNMTPKTISFELPELDVQKVIVRNNAAKSDQIKVKSEDEEPTEEEIIAARKFCAQYEADDQLIPLCQIAFCVNPMHNNVRKMYTDYAMCKRNVRKEILRMKKIPEIPEDFSWYKECFEKYQKELKAKELTEREYFYDGAKYFHRAYERYSNHEVCYSDTTFAFKRLVKLNTMYFGFKCMEELRIFI